MRSPPIPVCRMTPSAILVRALKPHDEFACGDLGRKLGIPPEKVRRAKHGARGQATRADYHLKLCAFLGVDPITGDPTGRAGLRIEFDAALFAMGVKMRRFERQQTITESARRARISSAVMSRIENGNPRSFASVLRAARAADLDPRLYTTVTRETATGNALTAHENRSAA